MAWLWTTISGAISPAWCTSDSYDTRTRASQIVASDTTPLRSIVDDPFALSYEDVEDDGACVVDDADACQGGLVAFDADADHFAVERKVFPGTGKKKGGR